MSDFNGAGPVGARFHGPRIGDDERNLTIDSLSAHVAAGRLSPDEFDERADVALRARTQGELDRLVADLEAARLPARAPQAPVVSLTSKDVAKGVAFAVASGFAALFLVAAITHVFDPIAQILMIWLVMLVCGAAGAALRGKRRRG